MDDLKNKRALVTGGNGYLGSHLVNALRKAGAEVYVMDKKKSWTKNEFIVDITERKKVERAIKKIQPQLVYHLAALLNRERNSVYFDKLMQVNHHGTINLLLALKDIHYCNFIFTSTGQVYGCNKPPFKEKMLPFPPSLYSISKLYGETAVRGLSNLYKKNFTILRIFNFFGSNMPDNFFIPQLLGALRKGKNFKMTKGEQARDFLHIDDVIQAMLLSANHEKAKNEIFNVCSGKSLTLNKLALELKKKLKSNSQIQFGAIPYREDEIWNMVGSNSKIKRKLGFKAHFDLSDIARMF